MCNFIPITTPFLSTDDDEDCEKNSNILEFLKGNLTWQYHHRKILLPTDTHTHLPIAIVTPSSHNITCRREEQKSPSFFMTKNFFRPIFRLFVYLFVCLSVSVFGYSVFEEECVVGIGTFDVWWDGCIFVLGGNVLICFMIIILKDDGFFRRI